MIARRAPFTLQVLRAFPIRARIDRERAIIATGDLLGCYTGEDDFPEETEVARLLGPEGVVEALKLGLAARLAYSPVGALIAGELPGDVPRR